MLLDIHKVEMFKLGAKHMQVWSIEVEGNNLLIYYGVEGGAKQRQIECVEGGKAGRTLYQQILSRFNSRINKQKLLGYKLSREEAMAGPSNALGLVQPMLAQVYKKNTVDISDAYVQYKYDGNRCLITNQDGEKIAYSRRGKRLENVDHILDTLELIPGETVDGELYAHGATLQEIVSWVRKEQPGTKKVKFHAYDIVSSLPYAERLEKLQSILWGENAELVPTTHISRINLDEYFRQAREEGYEGLILRVGESGYERNKRSKSLLKVKEFLDSEFKCVGIELSKAGVPVATCLANGVPFQCTLPGSFDEKKRQFEHKNDYLGQMLTVTFSGYTKDQVPFQPIAKEWRMT
jgi:DNA ligase-1